MTITFLDVTFLLIKV